MGAALQVTCSQSALGGMHISGSAPAKRNLQSPPASCKFWSAQQKNASLSEGYFSSKLIFWYSTHIVSSHWHPLWRELGCTWVHVVVFIYLASACYQLTPC